MSRRKGAPLRTEDESEYTPNHSRVPAARQLCTASNREVVDRPRNDRCPACDRTLALIVVRGTRRVRDGGFGGGNELADTRTVDKVYVIPSHVMRKQ